MDFIDIEHVIWVGIIGQSILSGFGIWACKDGVPAPKGEATREATRLVITGFLGWIGWIGFLCVDFWTGLSGSGRNGFGIPCHIFDDNGVYLALTR